MGLFNNRLKTNDKTQVPVWFMRQAGRYHNHYQGIRKQNDFMGMCKNPELALEITMGPINEFDFDAAILFSDLLFPLEHLDLGLSYHTGPPTLEVQLDTLEKVQAISTKSEGRDFYNFQGEALTLLRKELPEHKTLLGFVGAPFTLYSYSVEGAHKGNLISSKMGLYDGRFEMFCEKLFPSLKDEVFVQLDGGADAICLFDTAAGELSLKDYAEFVAPKIRALTAEIKNYKSDTKIIYYSKFTHLNYLTALEDKNIDVLGVDWRHDVNKALEVLSKDYYVQGNIDPVWLFLPLEKLEENLKQYFNKIDPKYMSKWIMGLGHGVLPKTPQDNVKKAVEFIHKNYLY